MDTTSQTSDSQSGGFLGLLGKLGTAYFGNKTAEAQAEAQAGASRTSLNSTGTVTPTAAPSTWIPGVENKTVVLAGVGLLVALILIRNK